MSVCEDKPRGERQRREGYCGLGESKGGQGRESEGKQREYKRGGVAEGRAGEGRIEA